MADLDVILRHGDDDTEGVLIAKGVSMVVLFIACMICGIIPLILAKKFNWISANEARNLRTSNRAVMMLLAFGGGVLLSTTFMHLIPEIEHNVLHLQREYHFLFFLNYGH